MIDPGFLLLAAIFIGAPIAIILWGIWLDWWLDRQIEAAFPVRLIRLMEEGP